MAVSHKLGGDGIAIYLSIYISICQMKFRKHCKRSFFLLGAAGVQGVARSKMLAGVGVVAPSEVHQQYLFNI